MAVLAAVLALLPDTAQAQAQAADRVPYRTKVYGETTDVFCHLDDPIENIACLAHDAGMGVAWERLTPSQATAVIAIELAGIIHNLASSQRANLYQLSAHQPMPGTSEGALCLKNYYGICGNHQELFSRATAFLGIPSRIVSIYYQDRDGARHSHAASEFLLDNKWRFIDVTWDAFWLRDPSDPSSMLSFEEVRARKAPPTHVNSADMWLMLNLQQPLDPFGYLRAPVYFLIQSGPSGLLQLKMTNPVERFADIPNYIGANERNAEMRFRVSVPRRRAGTYNIKVAALACEESAAVLVGAGTGVAHTLVQGDNLVHLGAEQTLSIAHRAPNICYAVLDRIEYVEPGRRK